MQPRKTPLMFLYALPLLLGSSHLADAGPLSKIAEVFHLQTHDSPQFQNGTLVPRGDCPVVCGYYSQLCCQAGQSCGTNANNEAVCTGGATAAAATTGPGAWQTYTSTWVETGLVTRTSIYSTWVPAAVATCTPNFAAQESRCGPKCCGSGYYCFNDSTGECALAGNGGYTTTGIGGGVVPGRPTTISGVITTVTIKPTTTMPYQTAVPTGANGTIVPTGGHSGLSGGAIAGIVIGVLLGIALLALICFICCLRAGFEGLLALFGLGKKRDRGRRTTVIEEERLERHHRHGSAYSGDRRWHGSAYSRPSRPSRPPSPKKSRKWGGIGAGLAGLGAALAIGKLKKDHDRRKTEKSNSSYSYSDSGYMYSDSQSSDSRTRRSSYTRRSSRPPPRR